VNRENSVTADQVVSSLLVSTSRRNITLSLARRRSAEALIDVSHRDFRTKLRQTFAEARSIVLGAGP
jgi:hypothetical protein